MDKEIWKDIIGYEGYYVVSSLGRVKRVRYGNRHDKNKTLACWANQGGYLYFAASIKKIKKNVSVHSAVAEAFIGSIPEGFEINHKDGHKDNNTPENLEYVKHAENLTHAHRTGLHKNNCEDCNLSQHTNDQVLKIIELFNKGITRKEIQKEFNISHTGLQMILEKTAWFNLTKDISIDRESQKVQGENCRLSKLTNGQVIDIFKLKNTGLQIKEVAKRYGVYPQAISDIWKGKTWKHITKITEPCLI